MGLLHHGAALAIAVRSAALAVAVVAAVRAARALAAALIVPRHLRALPRIGPWTTLRLLYRKLGTLDTNRLLLKHVCQDALRRGLIAPGDPAPPVWLWWQGQWIVTLANPIDIKRLAMEPDVFDKATFEDVGAPINKLFFGINIVTATHGEWKHHRKVVAPAFRRIWPTSIFGSVGRELIAEFDTLAVTKTPVDPASWMYRLALDALTTAAFGESWDTLHNPNAPVYHLYHDIISDLFNPATRMMPWLRKLRPARHRASLARIDQWNKFAYDLIDRKTAEVQARALCEKSSTEQSDQARADRDLLTLKIEATQAERFSIEDLRANINIFFLAGHDTTANALTAAIYLLGMHPDIQERAHEEVAMVMTDDRRGTDSAPAYPTNSQLSSLVFLTKCLKETMRLYPSVARLPLRKLARNIEVQGGVCLPKGTLVQADYLSMHRSPRYWDRAEIFDPDRWPDAEADVMHPGQQGGAEPWAWIPFSGGPRTCLGTQFSVVEQRVVMAMLLLRYRWRVVGNAAALHGQPESSDGILLKLRGVEVVLERRD